MTDVDVSVIAPAFHREQQLEAIGSVPGESDVTIQ